MKKEPSPGEAAKNNIGRPRKEPEDSQREWFVVGVRNGVEWATDAHYDYLRKFVKRAGKLIEGGNFTWSKASLPEDVEDFVDDLRREDRGEGFDRGSFAFGFVQGVLDFWSETEEPL